MSFSERLCRQSLNQFRRQSVCLRLGLACHSSRCRQFVSQSALAWSRLFLHLPFLLIASPVPLVSFFLLPSFLPSLPPSLLCRPPPLSRSQRVILEGEFISSVTHTIMLLQNIPHELLICVRLYVNYTPSHHVSVCVYAVFMCIKCDLSSRFESLKPHFPQGFILPPQCPISVD